MKRRLTGKDVKNTKPSSSTGGQPPTVKNERPEPLVAGEWVQVLSLEEIWPMLDERRRMKGLYFMPEMEKYAGRKLRVYKKVERIMLEATGEMRQIKRPTYYLEGAYCDGEFHKGCDRSCFLLWREEWLRRSTPPE